MPDFKYSALDIKGRKKTGIISASDKDSLKSILLEKHLFLLDFYPCYSKIKNKRLSAMELSEFCRELSSMLSSGIPLVRAIHIIKKRDLPVHIKNIFSAIGISVRKGSSLSEAMHEQDNVFPELMINMIKAGEESGKLDETTSRLAMLYEKQYRLSSEIKNAMAYPIVLLIMTVVIMIIIFTMVLPRFFNLFEGIQLPASTRAIITAGNFLSGHPYIIIAVTGLIIISVFFAIKTPSSRYFIDRMILKIPKIGKLMKIVYTSRFANTLSVLYSSGISLVKAVPISANTIGNSYISSQIPTAEKKIRSGNTLASAISEIEGFDRKLASSIAIGEESRRIDTLLLSLSNSYEYEASVAVKKLVSFIEPVMIIIMGGTVAFVAISVMQPIYLLYSSVGL